MQTTNFDLTEDEQEARFEAMRDLILRYWNEECWTDETLEAQLKEAGLIQPAEFLVNAGYPGPHLAEIVDGDVLVIYTDADYAKRWGGSKPTIDLFDASTGEYLAEPQGGHRQLYAWAEEELARMEGGEGGEPMTRSEWASYRADRELHRRRDDGFGRFGGGVAA